MKKALISTIEIIKNLDGTSGYRVAQVETEATIFPVADTMYWLNCDDNVVADLFYFDTTTNLITSKPPKVASQPQPTASGITTI